MEEKKEKSKYLVNTLVRNKPRDEEERGDAFEIEGSCHPPHLFAHLLVPPYYHQVSPLDLPFVVLLRMIVVATLSLSVVPRLHLPTT